MGISNPPNVRTSHSSSYFDSTLNQAFVVREDVTDRIIIGQQPDGSVGIKVSKTGQDVRTATDSNLIMNSAFNMFKIVDTDVLTLSPAPSSTTTASYTHNLGYIPAFAAYWAFDGTTYLPLPKYWFTTGGTLAYKLEVLSTATSFNAEFSYYDPSPDGFPATINIRFYLFQETAN